MRETMKTASPQLTQTLDLEDELKKITKEISKLRHLATAIEIELLLVKEDLDNLKKDFEKHKKEEEFKNEV